MTGPAAPKPGEGGPDRPLPWLARVAATRIPERYRDDIVADVLRDAERDGAPGWRIAIRLLRSARDSRRVVKWADDDRRRHLEGGPVTRPLLLPSWRDLRVAARSVCRARVSTAAIVLTLALAIGGTTAMFSAVHAVIMAPLPYADPAGLVRVWERHLPRQRERNVVAPANFMAWRDRAKTIASFAAMSYGSASITGDGQPERLDSAAVTWNLFEILGVAPAVGRGFRATDGVPNAERVVMLSAELWQRRYATDPAVVDRTLTINGAPARVAGILPEGFALFGTRRDIWSVLIPTDAWRQPRGRSLEVVARLAPGATITLAQAEMEAIGPQLEQQWPDFNAGWRIAVVGAREDLVGDLDQPLALLLAAVGVVLLIGCANAANLLIARASERRREFEVRAALGATRSRLLTELALEGFILGTAGTIAGLVVAALTLRGIVTLAETAFGVPRLETATLDVPVLAVALGLLSLCTIVFAVAPGWLATRATSTPLGTAATRVWTASRAERRFRTGLVGVQVAFAVVLVISAGLVGRSLSRLVAVPTGFDPENLLTFQVSLPGGAYPGDAQVHFFDRAATTLAALPGVERVGAISWIPFGGPGGATSFDVDGRVPLPAAQRPVADIRPVDTGYFDAMRIPITRGRAFTRAEVLGGARVAIVNETLVAQQFPNQDPIGQRLQVNWNTGLDEIVGVIADTRLSQLAAPPRAQIYFPQGTANVGFVSFVVRTKVDDEHSLARPAVAAIQALDPNLPVRLVQPMQSLVDASVAAPRLATWLIGAFGGLALLLALVGVAGLQAASVAARSSEFSIRLALGATPQRIRRIVIAQTGWLLAAGLGAGLLGAYWVSMLLGGLLFETPSTDFSTYLATVAAVAVLGLAASFAAVRRATRADPARALRG